jgi:hypothetical protein
MIGFAELPSEALVWHAIWDRNDFAARDAKFNSPRAVEVAHRNNASAPSCGYALN